MLACGMFVDTYTWQSYNPKDDTKLYCGYIQQLLIKIVPSKLFRIIKLQMQLSYVIT